MASPTADAPLALIGFSRSAARSLRELGLVAFAVPATPLPEVLAACVTLGCAGALVAEAQQQAVYSLVQPDGAARKQARVDAIGFAAAPRGTHTLEDALLRAVEGSGYPARGGRALLLGAGEGLTAALGLARLGLAEVAVASPGLPEAEGLLNCLPAGTRGHALHLHDAALGGLAERADLIVLASGELPRGLLQPYHALLDLSGGGELAARATQASLLPLDALPGERLALALEHATGQRFRAEALGEVAAQLVG